MTWLELGFGRSSKWIKSKLCIFLCQEFQCSPLVFVDHKLCTQVQCSCSGLYLCSIGIKFRWQHWELEPKFLFWDHSSIHHPRMFLSSMCSGPKTYVPHNVLAMQIKQQTQTPNPSQFLYVQASFSFQGKKNRYGNWWKLQFYPDFEWMYMYWLSNELDCCHCGFSPNIIKKNLIEACFRENPRELCFLWRT